LKYLPWGFLSFGEGGRNERFRGDCLASSA